jgi:hypothetical protein
MPPRRHAFTIMDRRLLWSSSVALVLHAGPFALSLRERRSVAEQQTKSEIAIEIVPIVREREAVPPELPNPAPTSAPSATRSTRHPLAARPRVEPAPASAADDSADADTLAPAAQTTPAPDSNSPTDEKHLSLEQLGLTGPRTWLPTARDTPAPRNEDIGGLKRGLSAHDVELGLGPGGAVAAEIRRAAQDLAPLDSAATISVDLTGAGTIAEVWLDEATSGSIEWRKVCRALQERLKKPFTVTGPVRITLSVKSQSAKRSGAGNSPFSFDLSNIGSPTLHTIAVRVLAESAR